MQPVVFQTRWAMSYLRGPLTRDQIKVLMDPIRSQFAAAAAEAGEGGAAETRRSGLRAIGRSCRPASAKHFLPVVERVPDGYTLGVSPRLVGQRQSAFHARRRMTSTIGASAICCSRCTRRRRMTFGTNRRAVASRFATRDAARPAGVFADSACGTGPREELRDLRVGSWRNICIARRSSICGGAIWSIARRSRANRKTISRSGWNRWPAEKCEAERAQLETAIRIEAGRTRSTHQEGGSQRQHAAMAVLRSHRHDAVGHRRHGDEYSRQGLPAGVARLIRRFGRCHRTWSTGHRPSQPRQTALTRKDRSKLNARRRSPDSTTKYAAASIAAGIACPQAAQVRRRSRPRLARLVAVSHR